MSSPSIPLVSALPQFSGSDQSSNMFSLAAASPGVENLLASVGGPGGLTNVNSLAASNPGIASILALMQPAGGLNPQQASQFGPLVGLLTALQGMAGPAPGGAPNGT